MKNLNIIIRNTFKILLVYIIFQVLAEVFYYLFAYLILIPSSHYQILHIFTVIYYLFPILSAILMVIVFYKYGSKYFNVFNKKQLIIPIIISFSIFIVYELLVLINGKFHDVFYLFLMVNPIASFYSQILFDELMLINEKFKITFIILLVVVENIANLTALYYGAKKKKDSEIAASDDTIIAENSNDSE